MFTVPISNSDQRAQLSFDQFGNIYLQFGNRSYQVGVDGKNILFLSEGDYQIINQLNDLSKLIPSNGMQFKKKIKDELDEIDSEGELDEENYLPEDDDYWIEEEDSSSDELLIDEDMARKYGSVNQPFKFWASDKELIPVHCREDGDISALYDTYIYEDKQLIFRSGPRNEDAIYRVTIIDGLVNCRPIGYTMKQYKLKVDDKGNLFFEVC